MTQPSSATHEVLNQSPPFEDVNLFAVDRPLVEAVAANGGAAAETELSEFGRHWGSTEMAARGRIANENCGYSTRAATVATRSSFIRPIMS
jgi:putative acyl-CoA dehydrogenase